MTTALILLGALVVAMVFLWYAGRREGRATAQRDQAETAVDHGKEGLRIDEDVADLPDDDLDDELRGR